MPEAWKHWEGQVVNGEFHLRQYLGGSERTAVYLTEHAERGLQKAAIKLLPADAGHAELQLSRWRLAAKLSHPHLLRLFHMGRCRLGDEELLYVVMEHAEENLSQVLPLRPLTPEEAREMLLPALDALAYLHGKRLVHCHLKPANILAVDDQLKLSSDGLCPTGESLGSPAKHGAYDPPESARGEISPAGDVWSLGMALVEALTQHLPALEGTEQGDPVLPKTLPEPFLDIARHCLRRDPQLRCTIAEIAARLRPAPPVPQRQAVALPPKARAMRHYTLPLTAVALALLVLLAAAKLFHRRPEPPQAPATAIDHGSVQPPQKQAPMTIETKAERPVGRNVHGEVYHQVLPDVSQRSRDTIWGTVRVSVKVSVDSSGSVVRAEFDSPGPSKYFANQALQAARRWDFWPPRVDGRNVPSEWILRFGFTKTATNVLPVQVSP